MPFWYRFSDALSISNVYLPTVIFIEILGADKMLPERFK